MESGNQQGRTVSLPFVAGLAVGEGCFYLAVQKVKGNRLRIKPGFRLVMNDHESVELAAKCLQDNGVGCHLAPRGDGALVLEAMGMKRSEAVASALLPWLTGVKRMAAMKLMEFVYQRMSKPANALYDEADKQIVRDLRAINGNPNLPRNTL